MFQFTTVANPNETTPNSEWVTFGEQIYGTGSPLSPHLRHRFIFNTIQATGVRILTPGGAAIDEIELY